MFAFKLTDLNHFKHNDEELNRFLKNIIGKYLFITKVFNVTYKYKRKNYDIDNIVIKVVKILPPDDSNWSFVDTNGDIYEPAYNQWNYAFSEEKDYTDYLKDIEKEKEKHKRTHIDIDPYSEEDWMGI